ncbi:hypothetical protein GUJ93_ZPchr0003g17484 [Zizania palustris]|uniref:Uncharacterized protein n=1 Tax=Zizania palustris TaxID=103762 RepID=A0A8J5SE38_ZIZPA|nr:hypothetical protein GUJ93_ZPchr0003g17484 [Zizania palustris]
MGPASGRGEGVGGRGEGVVAGARDRWGRRSQVRGGGGWASGAGEQRPGQLPMELGAARGGGWGRWVRARVTVAAVNWGERFCHSKCA